MSTGFGRAGRNKGRRDLGIEPGGLGKGARGVGTSLRKPPSRFVTRVDPDPHLFVREVAYSVTVETDLWDYHPSTITRNREVFLLFVLRNS